MLLQICVELLNSSNFRKSEKFISFMRIDIYMISGVKKRIEDLAEEISRVVEEVGDIIEQMKEIEDIEIVDIYVGENYIKEETVKEQAFMHIKNYIGHKIVENDDEEIVAYFKLSNNKIAEIHYIEKF